MIRARQLSSAQAILKKADSWELLTTRTRSVWGNKANNSGRGSAWHRAFSTTIPEISSCLPQSPIARVPWTLDYDLQRNRRSPGIPSLFFAGPTPSFPSSTSILPSLVSLCPPTTQWHSCCASVEGCSLMTWPRVPVTSLALHCSRYSGAGRGAKSSFPDPRVWVDRMRK